MIANAPQYMAAALDVVQAIISAATPALLRSMTPTREPFRVYGRAFAGMCPNPPQCWVQPGNTAIDAEGQGSSSASTVIVKLGIVGKDPDDIVAVAIDYILAVDKALNDAAPGAIDPSISRIYVFSHDYGPVYSKDGGFARFPEVHVALQMLEVSQ